VRGGQATAASTTLLGDTLPSATKGCPPHTVGDLPPHAIRKIANTLDRLTRPPRRTTSFARAILLAMRPVSLPAVERVVRAGRGALRPGWRRAPRRTSCTLVGDSTSSGHEMAREWILNLDPLSEGSDRGLGRAHPRSAEL